MVSSCIVIFMVLPFCANWELPEFNFFSQFKFHAATFSLICPPRARDIKERINKWDYIKLKSFCMTKEDISKMKGNQTYGKTHLPVITWTSVSSSKYIKNSHDSTPGRQTIQLKNGQRTWTDTSPRRTSRGPIGIWKDAQHH